MEGEDFLFFALPTNYDITKMSNNKLKAMHHLVILLQLAMQFPSRVV
jgi:hypothetical protein